LAGAPSGVGADLEPLARAVERVEKAPDPCQDPRLDRQLRDAFPTTLKGLQAAASGRQPPPVRLRVLGLVERLLQASARRLSANEVCCNDCTYQAALDLDDFTAQVVEAERRLLAEAAPPLPAGERAALCAQAYRAERFEPCLPTDAGAPHPLR
jgi:hypothetical protein